MQKVYVKTDSENRIIAINSSMFLTDTTDWIQIDEGVGDKYAHAQGNYFPTFIINDNGIFRYKLEDGKAVERTIDEIAAEEAGIEAITPEESTEDLLLEMAADHEYRLCLLELGVTENDI